MKLLCVVIFGLSPTMAGAAISTASLPVYHSYDDAVSKCGETGQDLCYIHELCPDGNPFDGGIKHNGADPWVAVRDHREQWILYGGSSSVICQTHDVISGNPHPCGPDLGPTDDACSWAGVVYCCGDTATPTASPTKAGPLALDYVDVKANFSSEAPNELEVGYLVGVGHEIKVEVFETCDANATPVPSGLYNAEDKQDMVSYVADTTNITHTQIIVGYHFNKTLMTNSTGWNSQTDEFTFCQVVSLVIPSALGAAEAYWVILQDRRKIALQFDMQSDIVLTVNLGEGTIENTTQTIDFEKDMEAFKCKGGEDDSFDRDSSALPPNTELAICLKIDNDSVAIEDVTKMTIDQDDKTMSVIANSGAVIPQITTKVDKPQEGFIVKTMVPINKFDFEQNKSLNITGVVELKLVGSARNRKLRVLVEDDATREGVEKAGYDVTVNLRSDADSFEPLRSSDGHAVVGKGLAALWFLVIAVVVFVV